MNNFEHGRALVAGAGLSGQNSNRAEITRRLTRREVCSPSESTPILMPVPSTLKVPRRKRPVGDIAFAAPAARPVPALAAASSIARPTRGSGPWPRGRRTQAPVMTHCRLRDVLRRPINTRGHPVLFRLDVEHIRQRRDGFYLTNVDLDANAVMFRYEVDDGGP